MAAAADDEERDDKKPDPVVLEKRAKAAGVASTVVHKNILRDYVICREYRYSHYHNMTEGEGCESFLSRWKEKISFDLGRKIYQKLLCKRGFCGRI